ncbi:HAD family phosphatase [Pelomonas sp. SE-A7]|uniref:HAD family hydrolase n=1 Tax=Pelomonas sp. SE-A7 TaxID=3054953 RepID=UPI00259D24D2|nr:HAD family phosphatase [Pelomonas sp. SE-A7]MDM4767629.1 HAD family phosphatase [Pelomonas sp. SE-A7]
MTTALDNRRFAAVVFDMDGLLLDSERPIREVWLRLAAADGIAMSEADYALTVGRNRQDTIQLVTQRFGSVAAAEAMFERVDAELAKREERFELMPGALALLQALAERRVPLALASSTHHAKVLERLRAAGLIDFFAAIHGGDQVLRGKPHPDLFLLAAQSLGLAPESCLVFEDSAYGAQGALAAGMGVGLVPDLKQPDAEIAAQCLVLGSLDQALPRLPAWFD